MDIYDRQYTYTDGSAQMTGRAMHNMVDMYYRDMLPYVCLSLPEIFSVVASIPYRPDPPEETLQRPYYTMQCIGEGGDCDDKAIAIASWAKLVMPDDPKSGRAYRFVAVRDEDHDKLHHVYPDVFDGKKYIFADATYNFNTLGIPRKSYVEYRVI